MVSGRGLGHTGGTLDKLESIPGFRTDLDGARFRRVLADCGLVLAGQSAALAPADRRLYALRDVTGTVESIPLIASSILSKKLAEGIDALVLDVKVGAGAFMKTMASARELARTLVEGARAAGKRASAFITDMEQPTGRAVGNLCELYEAVEVLRGSGPADTRALTIALGGEMLRLAGIPAGDERVRDAIASGAALERLRKVVAAQGGDAAFLDATPDYGPVGYELRAGRKGFVVRIDAGEVGLAAMAAGAGRARKEDAVDPRVALFLHKKVGEPVVAGEILATLHRGARAAVPDEAIARLERAVAIADTAPVPSPLIRERIT
jgi:pyrimidine-nucleoside phosphorylase/thymidine phosphorylase